MATAPNEDDDFAVDPNPPEEVGEVEEQAEATQEAEDGELVIEIDGDEEEKPESNTIREFRAREREKDRKIRELEAKLAPPKVEIGKKPDLWEDCDGDPEKFEAELLAYEGRKRQAAEQVQQQSSAQERQQEEWRGVQTAYRAKAVKLGVGDFEAAETKVADTLDQTVQGLIMRYAEDPAKTIYVLGKHANKLDELAAISDPIKALLYVRELEKGIKVTRRTPATQPEERVSGSGRIAAGADKELARLEAAADKSGDRSELIRYKRSKGVA